MSDLIAFVTSIDPLALLFLGGSLLFLWGLVRVLIDDIDLRNDSGESAPPEASVEATAAARLEAEEPPKPRPTSTGRRAA